MNEDVTWKSLIEKRMAEHKESWSDIEAMAPPEGPWLNNVFDSGFGGTDGVPFTVWSKNRVYFPMCYDGAEWADSVARHPDGKPTEHVGGG